MTPHSQNFQPLEEALGAARAAASAQISARLAGVSSPVAQAMRYATDGGKALRAFLVCESARLHDIAAPNAHLAAAAIECMHAYSLVHDDLPCMDDDDLRRGQPTVHRKWDEATAVLAGDGLQALAFHFLSDLNLPPEAALRLVATLAQAAGIFGMVGGQAADIAAETATAPLSLDEITKLQEGKTGALIVWSATAGPRMAGADDSALETYGAALGRAFQIADDILDVTGDAADVGKAVGKDAAAGKATFVSLLGLDGARAEARRLVDKAQDALSPYGQGAEALRLAAQYVISRKK